ncbi:MAG: hypothetical protein ACJAZ3_002062 [Sphingobacteriales bacterium]|jgi:hypothetical protein
MDFLSGFKEPVVLVCFTFSVLFYFFPDQGKRIGGWLITHLDFLSHRIRRSVRIRRWKGKKKALEKIYNPYEMQWLIIRTYSLMLLFAASITTYAILIAIGPLKDIGTLPVPIQYFIYSPVLVFEVLWLIQRETAKSLVKASIKRVTNGLNRPPLRCSFCAFPLRSHKTTNSVPAA